MEFERSEHSQEGSPAEALLSHSDSLLEVVGEWIRMPGHSIELSTGVDDSGSSHVIALEFKSQDGSVSLYFVPRSAAQNTWPGIKPIDAFVYEKLEHNMPVLRVRDKPLEKHLGFSFDDYFQESLMSPVLPFEQALKFAVMYAISSRGWTSFAQFDADMDVDDPLEGFDHSEGLLWVHLHLQGKAVRNGVIPGLGNDIYCHMPQ